MPTEAVPGSTITYNLISYDEERREREDDREGLMSARTLDALADVSDTDVFLLSHGWRGDVPAARSPYGRWIAAMAACAGDVARMKAKRPRFRPLLVGLHWPSEPWGDDSITGAASFDTAGADPVEDLVEEAAAKTVDTPTARSALRTIVTSTLIDNNPPRLPAEVRAAYAALDRETGLGHGGEAAAPGDDRELFDAEAIQDTRRSFPMADAPDDLPVFNGINGSTGDYSINVRSLAELSRVAHGLSIDESHLRDLREKEANATPSFAPIQGVDVRDLSQTGWGVIFPSDVAPAVKEALAPLLARRKAQANAKRPLFRVFDAADAYRKGEKKDDYLKRLPHSVGGGRGVGPGQANPKKIPYYLMLVGDPESIPYCVQYELDVDYAVGRLSFETPQEYADYASAVIASEQSAMAAPKRAVLFGAKNRGDRATKFSAERLVTPLQGQLTEDSPDWNVERLLGEDATKVKLSEILGGARTPSVLFTATHGMVFDNGDPRQFTHQGALLCQDWPGPLAAKKRITEDLYFSRDDVAAGAKVKNMIAFFFACYGAGTPQFDDFGHKEGVFPRIAPHDLVAGLPRRLLGLPGGGALAVVGHVERAWSFSFLWGRAGEQLDTYQQALVQLFAGLPVGAALEAMNAFYASISTMLVNEIDDIKHGRIPDDVDLSGLWTAANDARNFALLGDPAVRLPQGTVGDV